MLGAAAAARSASRVPGVEYVVADLARPLDPAVMAGVGFVVHCAAETAGGKDDHQRNSIDATRHVFEAAADAGVRQGVHVSSLAVMKPAHEVGGSLDEATPLDAGNVRRGPYVWGKAESELLVAKLAPSAALEHRRSSGPGPLVDYAAFHPPGSARARARPATSWPSAASGRRSASATSAPPARVIRCYVEDFAAAPPLRQPGRGAAADAAASSPTGTRRTARTCKFYWFPGWLLRALGGPLKLVQRVALGSKQPVDVYAAFASERYRTDVAAQVIGRAGASSIPETRG